MRAKDVVSLTYAKAFWCHVNKRIAVLALCDVVIQNIAAKLMNQIQFSLAQLDPAGGNFCT